MPALEIHFSLPRHVEGARVLDREGGLDVFAAIMQPVSFDYMQLPGVRRAVAINGHAVVQPNSVDNQSIAIFVMTDRFTVNGVLWLFAVRNIEIHAPHLRVALPHDPDLLRRLDENHWFAGI